MKRETIDVLHGQFEQRVRIEEATGLEFWLARELWKLMGYQNWRNFHTVIHRAIESCRNAGKKPDDHFVPTRTIVKIGRASRRAVTDFMLTSYACSLIAQNGEQSKKPIAFAQAYFAVRARRAELTGTWTADAKPVKRKRS